MWTYDGAGNILSRKEYAYTTAATSSLTGGTTVSYVYGDSSWGDLLTKYGTQNITYDTIGNMVQFGSQTFTWEHGRQLKAHYKDGKTWTFTYDANGIRTGRSSSSITYNYVYNGSQLTRMQVGGVTMQFIYGATGAPVALIYNGHYYYYVTNIQGDVIAILNDAGEELVTYTYDAWGNVTTTGNMASTLGYYNPLRYRGYVYDQETQLYYLQSRYYNPEIGRFISADDVSYLGADGSVMSYNLFAYCGNKPVNKYDPSGHSAILIALAIGAVLGGIYGGISAAANDQNVLAGIAIGTVVGGANRFNY